MPHHFYVNLILLVVGEYLKSFLLQPTRGLDVLFHVSRILVQDPVFRTIKGIENVLYI